MSTHVLSGRWTRDDRVASVYQELPFDVGPGTAAVEVELEYDRTGEAVIDLGCAGPDGFRGWSGGARDRYVITADAATPGYLPGPLTPGTWRVLLGLHRVPETGVPWRVTVTVSAVRPENDLRDLGHQGASIDALLDPARNAAALRPQGLAATRGFPAPAGMRWLAGDLHCHTVHSDGVFGVEGLARLAASRGLDYLAVTDHNTVSHHPFLEAAGKAAGIVLVPGQEVTTARGHANAFGPISRVEFRAPHTGWAGAAAADGGVMSLNHPLAFDCAWRAPLDEPMPLAEVWHSSWFGRDASPLAWWMTAPEGITAVGGSDFHRPGDNAEPGSPTTWLLCDDASADGVLRALAAGRAAVAADPAGPALLRVEDEVVAVGAEGLLLTGPGRPFVPVRADRISWPADSGKYWLETHDGVVKALTS